MKNRTLLAATLAFTLLLSGCKDEPAGVPGNKAETPPAPTPSSANVPITIELNTRNTSESIRITSHIPAGWESGGVFQPTYSPPNQADIRLNFNRTCGGVCDTARIPDNIQAAIEAFKEVESTPKEGQPVVEESAQGELEHGGKWIALAVRYPPSTEDQTVLIDKRVAEAYHQPAGANYYVVSRARAPADVDPAIWQAMLESIQSTQLSE